MGQGEGSQAETKLKLETSDANEFVGELSRLTEALRSLLGIDLITVEARIVVASIDTYLKYAEAVGLTQSVSRPALSAGRFGIGS